jgi:nicotinamide mononucleotide transporter
MMGLAEAAGFALAVVMVWCSIRELHWSWPLAIASSALYFFVFRDSQLYGEASLQVVFAVLALWGWREWLKQPAQLKATPTQTDAAAGGTEKNLPARSSSGINRLSPLARWFTLATSLLLWPVVALFLINFTDTDVPWWDGLVTALSLVGQFLLGRKYVENWAVWLLVNTVSIGLFAFKGLWLTVLLYAIFAVMSVIGWRTWQQQIQ